MMTMSPPPATRKSHSYLLRSTPEQAEIRQRRKTLPDRHSTILGHTDLHLQPRGSRCYVMLEALDAESIHSQLNNAPEKDLS